MLLKKGGATLIANGQYEFGNFASDNITLAFSIRVLFDLSATPFDCGLYGGLRSRRIPNSMHRAANAPSNSDP